MSLAVVPKNAATLWADFLDFLSGKKEEPAPAVVKKTCCQAKKGPSKEFLALAATVAVVVSLLKFLKRSKDAPADPKK
eukprot:CAMPEP_0198217054 /NCGR_PEP_ID=MMETSP1445-20131203/61301_1 /TAXON_ID=36898 /ORGANISM="Pyramimonas sp., Strain CCMP2087" /LENGTH=77 /DNA_ID=CAMNT_0043893563 /DNA_START=103 /DNA_END=336 /DNA_ORIENTATION=+